MRAAVDTGASVASQVASNALDGKPLGDGVGMAALSGAMASVGLGAVVEAGGSGVARLLGRGVEDAEGEAATVAHDVEGDVSKGDVCGLSFAANTPVTLADGSVRAIAALKTGDRVLAYDPTTSKAGPQPVEHVYVNHDANLVNVTLVADDASQAQATPAASDGKARDAAVAAHGTRAPPSAADTGKRAETIHTTTNHPWLTADHGWLPAGFLRVGERVVRADGTTAVVASVRALEGVAAMYDLTVGVVHTFAVGNGRYVVHNCGGLDDWRSHSDHFGEQWEKRGKPTPAQMDKVLQEGTPLYDVRSGNFGQAGKIGKRWYTLWYDATDGNKLVSITNEESGGFRPGHPKMGRDWFDPGSIHPGWTNPFAP